MPTAYIDGAGNRLQLADKLGTGGEGSVYNIQGQAKLVAKIYHKPVDAAKARKLKLMASMHSDALTSFAAWPMQTLHQQPGGPVQGIVLPRIHNAREIHELYSPAHRKQSFPTCDYRHLVRTARNCAIAFQTLHEKGIVIGDVNQGNFFVDANAIVRLIDCDSFQITSNGEVFKCLVGVAHFTPPELQNAKLSDCLRTVNHDNFGLAILVFHLLCMGRHPFAGRYSGKGDMPIEKAITELRFAFGKNADRFQMSPPPHALTQQHFPPALFSLFERAFASTSIQAPRPTAIAWADALKQLESGLRKCNSEEGHYFWGQIPTCPWCSISSKGGPDFFISISVAKSHVTYPAFDLNEVSFRVRAVPRPSYPPTLTPVGTQSLTPAPYVPDQADEVALRPIFGVLAIVLSLLGAVGALITMLALTLFAPAVACAVAWLALFLNCPMRKEREARTSRLKQATMALAHAKQHYERLQSSHAKEFHTKMQEFQRMEQQWKNLGNQRAAELQQLNSQAKEQQMAVHLKQHFISHANISGVGPSRVATLESFGIDTAWDVNWDAVERVPGFGPGLTSRVVAWRVVVEASFVFDPRKGVPQSITDAIEFKYKQFKMQLEREMRAIPEQLLGINTQYRPLALTAAKKVAQLEVAEQQARLDLTETPKQWL